MVAGISGKKMAEDSRLKADFHATIEKLLSGKEIIKVAHREPRLDKPNPNQFVDFKLKQLLNDQQMGDGEVPGWLLKVYENLQLSDEQGKMQTRSWLLQHLTDDLISREEKSEVQPPPRYKNNDINDSESGKITANEVVQLLENSLRFKKFDSDSKLLIPLKVQILKKLDETLVKLKSLLTERPKGWHELYAVHVSTVKSIITKLEEFLNEVEAAVLKEPVYDLKTKAVATFALDAKESLKKFKQNLKQWDNLAKIILENDTPFVKNDDIILVERKKGGSVETPKNSDEL